MLRSGPHPSCPEDGWPANKDVLQDSNPNQVCPAGFLKLLGTGDYMSLWIRNIFNYEMLSDVCPTTVFLGADNLFFQFHRLTDGEGLYPMMDYIQRLNDI